MLVRQQVRSGPLPDSEELQRYEQIAPGAAERIIRMAEKEQEFAHAQTVRNTRTSWYSMLSGSVMTILALGLAFFMVQQKVGGIEYVVGSVAVLVGVSITGRMIINRKRD